MKPVNKRGKWSSSDEDEIDTSSSIKLAQKKNKEASSNTASKDVLSRIVSEPLPDPTTSNILGVLLNEYDDDDTLENKVDNTDDSAVNDDNFVDTIDNLNDKEIALKIRSNEELYHPLFHGCRSVEEYQRLNFISQGTYGVVFRAKCLASSEIYALKQIKLGQEANKIGFPLTALREINILLSMNHENIMKVKEMVIGSTFNKIFMVMEYSDNDLKFCLEQSKYPFSTSEIKQLLLQFFSAMEYMHDNWIIHRDLKSSNLLYSNKGKLTVCDFGMARKYDQPILPYTREVVTLWYRSPELLLGSPTYSTPLDMWSVGCIFAEMLLGKPLFPGEGEIDQINKIFQTLGSPNEAKWPGCSSLPNLTKISWKAPTRGKLKELFPSASFSGGVHLNDTGFDLLSRLLHMDPNQRLSAQDSIKHPWISSEEPLPAPVETMPKFRSRHESTD